MFVVLSAGLWLMNKLTQDYLAVLRFTTELKHSGAAAIYTAIDDNTLSVQIKASGFFIVRERLSKNTQIVFDVKDLKLSENSKSELRLPTALLKDKLAEHLDENVHVMAIEPDSLRFKVSRNINKKVPVLASVELSFEGEYRQSAPIEFLPDSVTLSGSADELAQIVSAKAIIGKLEHLTRAVEGVAEIAISDNAAVKPKKVRYKIPVDRCTEGEILAPVNLLNSPKKSSITLLPSLVKVNYTVPLKHYSKIAHGDFVVTADFNDMQQSLSRKISLTLQRKPDEAFNVRLTPGFVELIIREENKF
ncbi:MAG: hypothetical protein LBC98_07110 [Prevotellaceae bacterium]|nr:hypothetical protein [Prevotellaceae bacterium]